ncbi:MAG: 3-hydroxyacyl-CoA dehydrogenase NAD-binding domain-containing protein [Oscillospiraceae bacterium]|nr:3-hydroxyacyl-CoA dehydrogenase NAD-binding domain-containing protein [Oscillospiraceae bacterium]
MIRNISVIGAGTMGHGIAEVFAMHGYPVSLYEAFDPVRNAVPDVIRSDIALMVEEQAADADAVERTLSNITLYSELEPAVKDADFVIEAIPEKLELKKDLFARLDKLCPPHTVFASNTSSLPLSQMIEDLSEARKARCMVSHWYNPAHLIPIAELSCFGNMEDSVFQEVYDLHVKAGKQPIRVLKDIPGLIANRMLHAMAREVFHLMEIGAASAQDIDKALKFGPGFRAATTGILETADMGGLDVWCACEDNLFAELDNSASACGSLRLRAERGDLGLKSGAGFFDYPAGKQEEVRNAFNHRLLTQLKASKEY